MKLFSIAVLFAALSFTALIEIEPDQCGQWSSDDKEIFCVDRGYSIGLRFIG